MRTYLILAILFGPIAEFYIGKIILGFLLFLIEIIIFIVGLNYPPCLLLFAIFIIGYWNHVFN